MNCNIIRDLIPLYIDGCLSDESIELVEEHLEDCKECQALLQIMKESAPVEEESEKPPCEPMERISLWKASLLQAILQFLSFLLIVLGVTMESQTTGMENGFWAVGLIVPATGFMLSLVNWYFVRLYRDRGLFSIVTALSAFTFMATGYVWAVFNYGISFSQHNENFSMYGLMFGIPISIILCIFASVFADIYGRYSGKERVKPKKEVNPRRFTLLSAFFCTVNSLTPLSIIITAIIGFTFDIRSYPLWTILILLLSGMLAVFMYRYEQRGISKADRILLTISLFMSLLNWVVCLFTGTKGNWSHNALVIGLLIGISAISVFAAVKFIKPREKGISRAIVAGVLAFLILQLSVIFLFFTGFGQNTVVKTADSPTGRYTAELVDSDQGALGGATVVYVTDNLIKIDFGLVTVHKQKEQVYYGEWGEYKGLTLRWVDNDTIKIGGYEHNMK